MTTLARFAIARGLIIAPASGAIAELKNSDLGATVAEALLDYRSSDVNRRAAVELPMIGQLHTLSWVNSILRSVRHEQPIFCLPKTLSLTVDQVMQILASGVRDDPEVAGKPVGYAVIFELQRVYPCATRDSFEQFDKPDDWVVPQSK